MHALAIRRASSESYIAWSTLSAVVDDIADYAVDLKTKTTLVIRNVKVDVDVLSFICAIYTVVASILTHLPSLCHDFNQQQH